MVINENNSYINTFTSGMNSDSAYDQLDNKHYVYGKNVRITKNLLLGGYNDYATQHEGIVTPVLSGVPIGNINVEGDILAVDSVDRLCTIITNNNNDLNVYRVFINEETNDVEDGGLLWKTENFWSDDAPCKVSTVLYKELENVIKLYIATGKAPLIVLRVDEEGELTKDTPIDCVINNRVIPENRVYINSIILGRLKTQQVQYTYRLYNKYTNTTQLAPLTNKIQVIDNSRSKENGNAEDTETSLGFSLKIQNDNKYWKYFKRIQVYRLSYIKPGEPAEVNLIYDDKLPENDLIINDIGIEPLLTLTIEEFSAMSGLILVPQIVELNQNYMFCGNVTDDTIIKNFNIQPAGHNLVQANIILSKEIDGVVPYDDNEPFTNDNNFDYEQYFELHNINHNLAKSSYENIFTSSLLRSLRRGETYKYAMVFYDKYGRRTDICKLTDVLVDVNTVGRLGFEINSDKLIAKPVGVKFHIPSVSYTNKEDIVGCQIIRRGSSDIYLNTLLQVALARPISQGLALQNNNNFENDPTKYSPYYPTGFLCINNFTITPTYYNKDENTLYDNYTKYWANTKNNKLFQIFSSEIDYRRNDVLEKLSISDTTISEVTCLKSKYKLYGSNENVDTFFGLSGTAGELSINRTLVEKLNLSSKVDYYWVFNYFEDKGVFNQRNDEVKSIKDVKIPNWEDGFTNVQKDGDYHAFSAIKKYKQFTTNIDEFTYNNWCSFGKYDLRPGVEGLPNLPNGDWWQAELLGNQGDLTEWYNGNRALLSVRNGYIGAGGSCLLLTKEEDTQLSVPTEDEIFYTFVCNIKHNTQLDNVESDETTMYYGFGNYFQIEYDTDDDCFYRKGTKDDTLTVFDGDVYITPHELTTMYKTYNFESSDTLLSTQITNYIPLESKVNTYFDYGMNLRNTNSANLLNEPGNIDGVTGQDRPAHLYNMVYSDNDTSNDVFTLISTDKDNIDRFKQRAYFSEPKTNGEFIDNFLIFKPASFIDVDSLYGQLTNMDTDKNNLYYWQDHAFGKFSVNERSLINDTNGNTIMLGLAGILSRYDYLSTKFGMRLYDFCSRTTENGLFWVDINNKAIVGSSLNGVINYGELLFVQNIINNSISNAAPHVDYDILNNELLCKCLNNGEQLIFNTKYNIATSVYTRNYSDIVYVKNHLFGIYLNNLYKLNYTENLTNPAFLTPVCLQFVVNPNTSITKTFDSQQIIPIKRVSYLPDVFNNTDMKFETDLYNSTYVDMNDVYTDREGNIVYNIPRFGQEKYGNRIRGKWMKVEITNNGSSQYTNISHVITKFRQSFS